MYEKDKKITAFLVSLMLSANMSVFSASASSAASYRYGDVNLDGVVDEADSETLKDALWGISLLSDVQRITADINRDLHVDFTDYVELNKILKAGTETETAEISLDENGKAVYYLNGNNALTIDSTGWDASVKNSATGSSFNASEWGLNAVSGSSTMFLNKNIASFRDDKSTLSYSKDFASSATKYAKDKISVYAGSDGMISLSNTYLNSCQPAVQEAARSLSWISQDDVMFAPTDYNVGGTVHVLGAEVTRLEDGYEFVNHISSLSGTMYSYLGHEYAVIGDAEFWYNPEEEQFTYSGIDPEDVVFSVHSERTTFNGKEVITFKEFAVVTDEYVYGLMYDPTCDWMCASVRHDRNSGECLLAQYTLANDMTTVGTHFSQEGVIEKGINEEPEKLLYYLDECYDEEGMVFETIMYSAKTKAFILGAMGLPGKPYGLRNGISFAQVPAGINAFSIVNYDESSTEEAGTSLSFADMSGSKAFALSNTAGGVSVFNSRFLNSYSFNIGDDTFAFNNEIYAPEACTYSYAEPGAVSAPSSYGPPVSAGKTETKFAVSSILNERTPSMY